MRGQLQPRRGESRERGAAGGPGETGMNRGGRGPMQQQRRGDSRDPAAARAQGGGSHLAMQHCNTGTRAMELRLLLWSNTFPSLTCKTKSLSGPISCNIAILSLRDHIVRYLLSGLTTRPYPSPKKVRYPRGSWHSHFHTDASVRCPILQHVMRYLTPHRNKHERASQYLLSLQAMRDMKIVALRPLIQTSCRGASPRSISNVAWSIFFNSGGVRNFREKIPNMPRRSRNMILDSNLRPIHSGSFLDP